jgi:hypothetical protein
MRRSLRALRWGAGALRRAAALTKERAEKFEAGDRARYRAAASPVLRDAAHAAQNSGIPPLELNAIRPVLAQDAALIF